MDRIAEQIRIGTSKAEKFYRFDEGHDRHRPAEWWFQESHEGLVIFVVFYTQACRWSRCIGCSLPSKMSQAHVPFDALMDQIDHLFEDPEVIARSGLVRKMIVSNNGSVLDERTFSSTALMYLVASANRKMPFLESMSLETRVEYVDVAELEFLSRALAEGTIVTRLELAVGFEAFDDQIRNKLFDKGMTLQSFERFVAKVAPYRFGLKCYFMLKPVPGMSDEAAVQDIHQAIDYLSEVGLRNKVPMNIHLNPTYVAAGTKLEEAFKKGEYQPPTLRDVARAARHARGKAITVFVGLSDEGLACPGGSFLRSGDEPVLRALEEFNRTENFELLDRILEPATAQTARS